MSEPDDPVLGEVLAGLRGPSKSLPPKLFYDARGTELFERITALPEYYPTRCELAILAERGATIAAEMAGDGDGVALVEPGSGTSVKVRLLLAHLPRLAAYVPVEISRAAIDQAVAELAERFPRLPVIPVHADYTKPFDLPHVGARRAVFFPGSTIGNFDPAAARAFLRRLAHVAGPGGALVIGVDLRKDEAVLHAAYDDAAGVTAAFNRNILEHLNRRFGADFAPERFDHLARWDAERGRIEMHLVSSEDQVAHVGGEAFRFARGERIHTESSYKYTIEGFRALARAAGFEPRDLWTDDRGYFSVHLLEVA